MLSARHLDSEHQCGILLGRMQWYIDTGRVSLVANEYMGVPHWLQNNTPLSIIGKQQNMYHYTRPTQITMDSSGLMYWMVQKTKIQFKFFSLIDTEKLLWVGLKSWHSGLSAPQFEQVSHLLWGSGHFSWFFCVWTLACGIVFIKLYSPSCNYSLSSGWYVNVLLQHVTRHASRGSVKILASFKFMVS